MRTLSAMALLGACTAPPSVPRSPDAACVEPAEGGVHKGFESGDFEDWSEELADVWSGTVVDYPVRCGDHAARFEVRHGDSPEVTNGFRAELHELTDFSAPVGTEHWYALSTWLPVDWPALDNRTVIAQWHATPDLLDGEVWRSPPLAVRTERGEVFVTARWSDVPVQEANDAPELELFRTADWDRGVWHDWVFHVRWSFEDDGLVEAWLDGEPVISYDGPVGYHDRSGVWFKWGIYRDDHETTQVLFHDAYRRGPTSESVGHPEE